MPFFSEPRQVYKELVKQLWSDANVHLHPDERIYTCWNYLRTADGRNAWLRLDHLLLIFQVSERLMTSGVDTHSRGWEKSSDHAPIWIELSDI